MVSAQEEEEEEEHPMERLRRAEAAAAEYIVAMEAQRFAADHQHAPPLPLALVQTQPLSPQTEGAAAGLVVTPAGDAVGRLPDLAVLQRRLLQVWTTTPTRANLGLSLERLGSNGPGVQIWLSEYPSLGSPRSRS